MGYNLLLYFVLSYCNIVNTLTNDKGITEIQNVNVKLLKNNVKCQCHLKVKVIVLHVC